MDMFRDYADQCCVYDPSIKYYTEKWEGQDSKMDYVELSP